VEALEKVEEIGLMHQL